MSETEPSSNPRSQPAAAPVFGAFDKNPEQIDFWGLIAEDWRTHDRDLLEQGFWAVAVHRFGNWRMSVKPRLFRIPFSILYRFMYKFVEWTCGISLPYNVRLGRRVRIWHHSGIILSAESIGDDVQIRQNTTIGVLRTEHNFELPHIEEGVDIGAHVCILGRITIGKRAVIGAGSVVLSDIPAGCLAVGVPAKVIKRTDAEEAAE